MNKEVVVQFDIEAYHEYMELQDFVAQGKKARKMPTYEKLLSSINTAIRNIKSNPYYGDLIPRRLISKATINKYGTDKIFRVELVGFWRMLYTLIGSEARIIAFILEYMDQGEYDRVFGYRKK